MFLTRRALSLSGLLPFADWLVIDNITNQVSRGTQPELVENTASIRANGFRTQPPFGSNLAGSLASRQRQKHRMFPHREPGVFRRGPVLRMIRLVKRSAEINLTGRHALKSLQQITPANVRVNASERAHLQRKDRITSIPVGVYCKHASSRPAPEGLLQQVKAVSGRSANVDYGNVPWLLGDLAYSVFGGNGLGEDDISVLFRDQLPQPGANQRLRMNDEDPQYSHV
jgi:hypothetical protein